MPDKAGEEIEYHRSCFLRGHACSITHRELRLNATKVHAKIISVRTGIVCRLLARGRALKVLPIRKVAGAYGVSYEAVRRVLRTARQTRG